MPFLIYTDRENLGRSLKASRVRVPSSLARVFDLSKIAPGDLLFLFDYASGKAFGPLYAGAGGVSVERNPKGGPFNGFGKVKSHYTYTSIGVDCASLLPRGAEVAEIPAGFGAPRFSLTADEGRSVLQKLRLVNRRKVPLVLQVDRTPGAFEVTVVEMNRGTRISRHRAPASDGFFALFERKARALEALLLAGRERKYEGSLRQLGALLYENLLRPCGLDELFSRGGYAIDVAADPSLFGLPLELAFRDSFLFEGNTVTYRRVGEAASEGAAAVGRVLVVADPSGTHRGAYREGVKIHRFFSARGVTADLVARPFGGDAMNDMLASYDVVHFCGHWATGGGGGGWETGEGVFGAADVVRSRSLPALVFSSACGNGLPLAGRLSEKGVGNVIASRWRIADAAMDDFSLGFYTLLLDGLEIGTAFNEALVRAYVGGNPHPLSFFLMGEGRRVYECANRRR
jgi:hypothetical protein